LERRFGRYSPHASLLVPDDDDACRAHAALATYDEENSPRAGGRDPRGRFVRVPTYVGLMQGRLRAQVFPRVLDGRDVSGAVVQRQASSAVGFPAG